MMFPHPALPANPSLWSLNKIHEQATRWLDHCDSREDFEAIEEFIYEVEIKINELTQVGEFLDKCLRIDPDHAID